MPQHRSRPSGFTLIEMVIVMTLVGILMTVAFPFFRGANVKGEVRAGADALANMHAVAKQVSIQRGRTTRLIMDPSAHTALVAATKVSGVGLDTVGKVENLNSRYGVTFTTTTTTLVFSPRGLGTETSGTTIIVSKGGYADTMTVSAAGRLVR